MSCLQASESVLAGGNSSASAGACHGPDGRLELPPEEELPLSLDCLFLFGLDFGIPRRMAAPGRQTGDLKLCVRNTM